ncbi:STAS domain-containing protein [Paenibacillus sp. P26]|nr:STAS domain-containing protein [Paenibacillus sp. P26]
MDKPLQTFEVFTRRMGDDNVVWLQGELDLSKVAELRATLDPFVADTKRKLILNLKHLQYIDSTGIGVIVSVLKARELLHAPFAVEDIPLKSAACSI